MLQHTHQDVITCSISAVTHTCQSVITCNLDADILTEETAYMPVALPASAVSLYGYILQDYLVKRIQSTSRNAPSLFFVGRELKNPTFAPIHLPSLTAYGSPHFWNFLPSKL